MRNFLGGWNKADSENPEAGLSRTRYVLIYATCLVLWCRKLQTEIALITTEMEYVVISKATIKVLPFMNILKKKSMKYFC